MSKKPTKKQLAARKLFAIRVRRGDFKKSGLKGNLPKKQQRRFNNKHKALKLLKIRHARDPAYSHVMPSKTKRDRGGSFSDIDKSLLLAINDPNVKEIIIKK